MAEELTLFDRIGGLKGLQKVVKRFYKTLYWDDLVGHYFKNLDLEELVDHQLSFLRWSLGSRDFEYTPKALGKVHADLNITEKHFNRVGERLIEALNYAKVGQKEIDEIMAIVVSVKDQIVKEPTQR